METNDLLDMGLSANSPKLSIADKAYMQVAAKWAKFLAIVYFIFEGLMVLVAFALIAGGSALGAMFAGTGYGVLGAGFGAAIGLIYLIFIALAFFPTLYLYRFAARTQDALRSSNDDQLTDAFKNLSAMFKFMGIMMAVILGFYALAIVFGGLGALMSR